MAESFPAESTSIVGGGSAAARAYREQLAREGQTLPEFVPGALAASAGGAPTSLDARRDERVIVNGRVKVCPVGAASASGRVVDLSRGGVCVLMDDPMRAKTPCTLEIDVFHNGKRQVFANAAVCVYSVLAAGKGFKVGFQFGAKSTSAQAAISALIC